MTALVPPGVPGRSRTSLALVAFLLVLLAGCGAGGPGPAERPVLTLGAIPDQDPHVLQRRYAALAEHLSEALDVEVAYRPVTDYAAAVSLFRTGDLQLVWFGGLTGVQARLQTPGAVVLAQRDIDVAFHSLFLASADSGLAPVDEVAGLHALQGRRFTYGSQSSTSGYLMPAWFLRSAGVDPQRGFAGPPGFSGSHDKTIDLVASGTYEAGAVNEQVWASRVAAGTVDPTRVRVLLRSPPFADYHWLLGPAAVERFGADFPARVGRALLDLDADDPDDAAVLELFGAQRFVPASADRYASIEQIGRELGLISE